MDLKTIHIFGSIKFFWSLVVCFTRNFGEFWLRFGALGTMNPICDFAGRCCNVLVVT